MPDAASKTEGLFNYYCKNVTNPEKQNDERSKLYCDL
jgi:hypothetical protein